MKSLEGRIGKKESAAAALMAALISGLFAINTGMMFENGNSAYISTILSALASLLIFLLVLAAMKKSGARDLYSLYRIALGRYLGCVMGTATAFALVLSASFILTRFLLILCRYVYVDTQDSSVALYFLICIIVLASLGLESIARTAKLFLAAVLLSLSAAFVIAAPAYHAFRLYPLLGDGLQSMMMLSVRGIGRFFPALLSLLILFRGVHGAESASLAGKIAAIGGGVFDASAVLLLGMTYTSRALSKMHAPMYRITMSVRSGSGYIRLDKLLLFFWSAGGMIAGAYYIYSGALLFTRSLEMRDVRPAAVCFGAVAGVLTLMGHKNMEQLESLAALINRWYWMLIAAPPLIASLAAVLRKSGKEGNGETP